MTKRMVLTLFIVVLTIPAWASVMDMDTKAYHLQRQKMRQDRQQAQQQWNSAIPQLPQGQTVKDKPAEVKPQLLERQVENTLNQQEQQMEPKTENQPTEQEQKAELKDESQPTEQGQPTELKEENQPTLQEQKVELKVESQQIQQEPKAENKANMDKIEDKKDEVNAEVPTESTESEK